MMEQQTRPIEVFYSYADKDEALCLELEKHLSLLHRQELAVSWHRRKILGGTFSQKEIDEHLRTAPLILLFVSPDYIASDYCYSKEMLEAIHRHVAHEARVIPVILRPVQWQDAPFGNFSPILPKDAKPVTKWANRDEAYLDIADGIYKVIKEIRALKTTDLTDAKFSTVEHKKPTSQLITFPQKAFDQFYTKIVSQKDKKDFESVVRIALQDLLNDLALTKKWMLFPELPLQKGAGLGGTIRDHFGLDRGYWEAKGPKTDLNKSIDREIEAGHLSTNTIFENTQQAVLFQDGKRSGLFDLTKQDELINLQKLFFSYTNPAITAFDIAVEEFKQSIPDLAYALLAFIRKEHQENEPFKIAFNEFFKLCRKALNPDIKYEEVDIMLVQHLLAERLFRTVLNNPDFAKRNVIAVEVEKVIDALTSRTFSRDDFTKSLDLFYASIEGAARGIPGDWTRKRYFLNTVYERFFRSFSAKDADKLGIAYTPGEIVDLMRRGVEELLQIHFNKRTIQDPEVQILDPATGTGSFILNIFQHIKDEALEQKYSSGIFCNEIMLLPYYIASLNIERAYYERTGSYKPFEGICFTDTLELGESPVPGSFVEENTRRIQQEKKANIVVVMGNPPYNVGQKSENENNKNRHYPLVEERIYDSYVAGSQAQNTRALGDTYVKFFRWSTDRLLKHDGIVCFVSNNRFLDAYAFDGFRKSLAEEFTHIYHINLGGNANRGGGGNVFGVKVGIGITFLVRRRGEHSTDRTPAKIYYFEVDEHLKSVAKLAFLSKVKSIAEIEWQEIHPKNNRIWFIKGLRDEFKFFVPIGVPEIKNAYTKNKLIGDDARTIFTIYSRGAETTRDSWMYDFDATQLVIKAQRMIDTYNKELSRWKEEGEPKDIDDFVLPDESKIKWSSSLKKSFQRSIKAEFDESAIRNVLYRPFTKKFLYFDKIMTHRQGRIPIIFPNHVKEGDNIVIWLKVGSEWPMFALAANIIPDLLPQGGSQCFPYYVYSKDGSKRHENITDWVLKKFQSHYSTEVTKRDIFHYVYSMLHHPQYREYYAENLKSSLPRIPLVKGLEAYNECTRIGKRLMDIHINYEREKEYPLQMIQNDKFPQSWHIKKMRLSSNRTEIIVNNWLTLSGIPAECFQYQLGIKSALEWIIDQYKIHEDKRSKIVVDPNQPNDGNYIVKLIGQIVTVSIETVQLINQLAQATTYEDWVNSEFISS